MTAVTSVGRTGCACTTNATGQSDALQGDRHFVGRSVGTRSHIKGIAGVCLNTGGTCCTRATKVVCRDFNAIRVVAGETGQGDSIYTNSRTTRSNRQAGSPPRRRTQTA